MSARWFIPAAVLLWGALAAAWLSRARADRDAPPARAAAAKTLRRTIEKLRPLHSRLPKPKPGDWLYHHRESGQTFQQYIASRPVVPDEKRRVIYVQPLGRFTPAQRKVVKLAAEFVGLCFSLPVRINQDLPLSVIPARARRTHPSWGDRQVLTSYVLDDLLRPRLAKDAFALIAFTSSDLWPGRGWNFVFGQASLRGRVGVWSIYRFGDPAAGAEGFRLCLLRTMRTATHELGHMFSMLHCTAYQCNMCGSNSLNESDRRPLAMCPECMAKVCWATGADAVRRYRKLAGFCRTHGLTAEAGFYERSLKALGAAPAAPATRPATRPS